MYKYEESGETDDMLEFDASVDVTLDSTLVDIDDDFFSTRPDGERILVVFGDMESNHDEDSNLQKTASDHDEETKSQKGPKVKPKANIGKTIITYNKRGVPIGDGAKKLATFEGITARTMVPITFDSWCWLEVPKETKEDLWKYVLMQETGKTKDEIDKATLWKKARKLKA
ncbi:hypothetical protein L1987_78488 [Smallanthus sonchifolius]|uniref:Uncharacterized protein n=1 Tax=Smallanthus sonchifolius TaxID=185202 RepID=A0ACB8ZDC8_9ASTR|nr:hypothetical protein L1987_78488 [Smallanthus sonchifolius]